ncbi:MAG: imidazole glycerol phosphate synthase subunit HisF [Candidatus Rokubacteria bacterium GWC2_70_16]|nr:MAG: imidazole glycerol phosphate synthase subunit HisF [Candidatus Rokubacteria bacterium GWC2_70_16]OGL17837.1 MAG: imidazole glycerol phosphate synthase subunit HisF [Candidatus Rokubacteria bacterium RIFCSPLOWO2_12_FULL_71_19]
MPAARVIARLDVKAPNLVKGIHLEGLRVMGDPRAFARRYYAQGADEILYVDIVASLYGRNSILDVVRRTAEDVFVPMTVAGGLRSVEDVRQALRSGADKVAINTAAVRDPDLIRRVAEAFGSQCMVVDIQTKRTGAGQWEAYTDNGRERTGVDALEWAERAVALGAGELLITSVDREGTQRGMELDFLALVTRAVDVPVIACGGVGSPAHARQAITEAGVDAVAVASVLHYGKVTIAEIKAQLAASEVAVRVSA